MIDKNIERRLKISIYREQGSRKLFNCPFLLKRRFENADHLGVYLVQSA
jgi:hypothetical protein